MQTITYSVDRLLGQWRRQILAHRDPRSVAARKGFVALSIVDQANTSSVFVNIGRVLVVLLYEDEFYSDGRSQPSCMPLRLIGYRVRRARRSAASSGAVWPTVCCSKT